MARFPPESPEALTKRETEVLRLLAQGQSNKQIAHRLPIETEHQWNYKLNLITIEWVWEFAIAIKALPLSTAQGFIVVLYSDDISTDV